MSYFEESATLPPPFNILPTPKLMFKMLGLRKKDKQRKEKSEVSRLIDFIYSLDLTVTLFESGSREKMESSIELYKYNIIIYHI